MGVEHSVEPVACEGDKAKQVIHREPIQKEVNCLGCLLATICETGDRKQRPVITSDTLLTREEWIKKLKDSNCNPSVPPKYW